MIGLKKRKSAKRNKEKRTSRLPESEPAYGAEATGLRDLAKKEKKLNWGQIKNNNLTQHGCTVEL